jgi:hypothetical protein
MEYTSKYEGEVQTLTLCRDPFHGGLGLYLDQDGETWDVRGVFGTTQPHPTVVAARKDEMHPYFSDTSGDSYHFVQQTWLPYYVVVVDESGKIVKDYRMEG